MTQASRLQRPVPGSGSKSAPASVTTRSRLAAPSLLAGVERPSPGRRGREWRRPRVRAHGGGNGRASDKLAPLAIAAIAALDNRGYCWRRGQFTLRPSRSEGGRSSREPAQGMCVMVSPAADCSARASSWFRASSLAIGRCGLRAHRTDGRFGPDWWQEHRDANIVHRLASDWPRSS